MRYSSRFFLYAPFLLFVALAASVMIYWGFAASAFSQRLDALNGREIMPGVRMSFTAKRVAGFPFRLDAIFDNFTLQIAGTRGPMTWHADHFAEHALTYESSTTVMEAAGQQELSWVDETGAHRVFAFVPGTLRASSVTEDGKLARFDLVIVALGSPKFAAARAQFHLRRDPADADALDLVFDLQSVGFAGEAAAGFVHGLTQARIEGRLSPARPFAPVLAGRADWRPAIEMWRNAPGSFKIDEAAFAWDKCQATSGGLVTLDDAHRLSGSLAFDLACNALAKQAATVTASSRGHRAILAALADLASREPADRNGALPVMLVFKDGLLYVGPGTTSGAGAYFEPIGFLHVLY